MAPTEAPQSGALDLKARGPLQGRRQCFRGPVRPIASAALGAVWHPPRHRRRPRLGHPPHLTWGPGDL
jgi:hypothetical protein